MTSAASSSAPSPSSGASPRRPASPAAAILDLLASTRPVAVTEVPTAEAVGRYLAAGRPLHSDRDSPAHDVSAMDGFCVRAADLPGPLPIAGEVRIGLAPPDQPAGACLRIVTGGPVPAGADLVVKREDVHDDGRRITIDAAVAARLRPGEHIRRRGENGLAGAAVGRDGQRVTPALVGTLASMGIASVEVHRPLRVAVLVTGDELRPSDAPRLEPWELRDSNGPALVALLRAAPWIGTIDARRVADDEAALDAAIDHALATCDALLLTGGVSMGHRDFVPGCLARAGVATHFHTVPQRPGKPVLGGIARAGQPVLALPGNPVSVLVTARRMAWPVLRRLAGGPATDVSADAMVQIRTPDAKRLDLWWQRLVREVEPGSVDLVGGMGSGDVLAAGASDGFVELPPGASGFGPWPFHRWIPGGDRA